MKTEIVKVDPTDIVSAEVSLRRAAEIIKNGGLVVFPTETVYGLGGNAIDSSAAAKIYSAKGRPADNPLIIHIATPADAEKYTYTCELYYKLAERFMPGPLTVIMKSRDIVPCQTRAGLSTVAVRCPENPIANRLIALSGVPIAAPSANLSGSPSPTKAEHAADDMLGRVDMIIDGGECEFGLESTIVKIEDDMTLTLLRPGKITPEELSELCELRIADAVTHSLKSGEAVLSPGMKYRHYAPKAPVLLLDGDVLSNILYIQSDTEKRVALISYSDDKTAYEKSLHSVDIYTLGARTDEVSQAHTLFALLRDLDKRNYDKIYAPLPEKRGIGLALYNRMIRAAAHRIIKTK